MSPKVKKSALNVTAALGAVLALSGLMRPIANAVDERYVHAVTYSQDSINAFYRQQFITAKLAKIDTINMKLDTLLAHQRGPRR